MFEIHSIKVNIVIQLSYIIGTSGFHEPCIEVTVEQKNLRYINIRVAGLRHDDHNDLNNTILNDRHIYDMIW